MMSRPGQEEKQKITGLHRVTSPPWDRLRLTARWNDESSPAVQNGSGREKRRPASFYKDLRRKICFNTAEQTSKQKLRSRFKVKSELCHVSSLSFNDIMFQI